VEDNSQDNGNRETSTPNFQNLLAIIEEQSLVIEEQTRSISELQAENEQLKVRIAELESRLNQNCRNSNRPPSTDGFRRHKSQQKNGGRPPGGQKRA
jgi:transposase